MCGILGISGNHKPLVQQAALRMKHRGPDAYGVYADDKVTLGHNRLAIIDLDERATQPLFDESGQTGIVFNGEIYNYKEVRATLEKISSIHFKTQSDTEVLLYAYRQWGEELVHHVRGMYAFAIYDKEKNKIILFSDQAAIKPIYYTQKEGVFAFASELAPVLLLLGGVHKTVSVDEEAVRVFFSLGSIPAPRTLYSSIYRLPPRTIVSFDLVSKELQSHTYTFPESTVDTVEALTAVIEDEVQQHLVADVPVGLFFSGGTDSSLIASMLKKKKVSLEAFCVEIMGRPEDAEYARRIAKELNVSLHTFHFGVTEFDSIYQEVVSKLDEPLADSSLFPTYFVATQAAKQVKVVLSGEGGDEFFYGYPRSLSLALMRNIPLRLKVTMLERLFFILPAFRGKNKLFEILYAFFHQPLSFYLLTMSPTKSLMSFSMWKEAKKALQQSVRQADLCDADTYLPNVLLRKTDLATMYTSIEGRVPLLSVAVMQAARTLKQKITKGTGLKPVLKRILSTYLPHELVYRKKTGFGLRTKNFFAASVYVRADMQKAVTYLSERKLLPISVPAEEVLIERYPALAWQLIALYHALKNTEI